MQRNNKRKQQPNTAKAHKHNNSIIEVQCNDNEKQNTTKPVIMEQNQLPLPPHQPIYLQEGFPRTIDCTVDYITAKFDLELQFAAQIDQVIYFGLIGKKYPAPNHIFQVFRRQFKQNYINAYNNRLHNWRMNGNNMAVSNITQMPGPSFGNQMRDIPQNVAMKQLLYQYHHQFLFHSSNNLQTNISNLPFVAPRIHYSMEKQQQTIPVPNINTNDLIQWRAAMEDEIEFNQALLQFDIPQDFMRLSSEVKVKDHLNSIKPLNQWRTHCTGLSTNEVIRSLCKYIDPAYVHSISPQMQIKEPWNHLLHTKSIPEYANVKLELFRKIAKITKTLIETNDPKSTNRFYVPATNFSLTDISNCTVNNVFIHDPARPNENYSYPTQHVCQIQFIRTMKKKIMETLGPSVPKLFDDEFETFISTFSADWKSNHCLNPQRKRRDLCSSLPEVRLPDDASSTFIILAQEYGAKYLIPLLLMIHTDTTIAQQYFDSQNVIIPNVQTRIRMTPCLDSININYITGMNQNIFYDLSLPSSLNLSPTNSIFLTNTPYLPTNSPDRNSDELPINFSVPTNPNQPIITPDFRVLKLKHTVFEFFSYLEIFLTYDEQRIWKSAIYPVINPDYQVRFGHSQFLTCPLVNFAAGTDQLWKDALRSEYNTSIRCSRKFEVQTNNLLNNNSSRKLLFPRSNNPINNTNNNNITTNKMNNNNSISVMRPIVSIIPSHVTPVVATPIASAKPVVATVISRPLIMPPTIANIVMPITATQIYTNFQHSNNNHNNNNNNFNMNVTVNQYTPQQQLTYLSDGYVENNILSLVNGAPQDLFECTENLYDLENKTSSTLPLPNLPDQIMDLTSSHEHLPFHNSPVFSSLNENRTNIKLEDPLTLDSGKEFLTSPNIYSHSLLTNHNYNNINNNQSQFVRFPNSNDSQVHPYSIHSNNNNINNNNNNNAVINFHPNIPRPSQYMNNNGINRFPNSEIEPDTDQPISHPLYGHSKPIDSPPPRPRNLVDNSASKTFSPLKDIVVTSRAGVPYWGYAIHMGNRTALWLFDARHHTQSILYNRSRWLLFVFGKVSSNNEFDTPTQIFRCSKLTGMMSIWQKIMNLWNTEMPHEPVKIEKLFEPVRYT
jgi:hypothetical protein